MRGRIGTGIVVILLTGLVAAIVALGMMGIFSISLGDVDIFMNLLILIPLFMFFTWIFSLILGGLSHWDPVFYFIACLLVAVVALIMGLNGAFYQNKDEFANVGSAIGMHGTFFFIFIPKIDSESQDYVVTETTYLGGFEVDRHSYLERRYLSGSLVKLVAVAILGGLAGYFAYGSYTNPGVAWIVFGIEALLAGFKIIQSLRA